MNTKTPRAIVAIMLLMCGSSLFGQAQRASPHDAISPFIEGNYPNGQRISIFYGRPYRKAPRGTEIRKIWGGLVPYDKWWRLGADEATLLVTAVPLDIGGATVPPGAYTLYMWPVENGPSKLIINKQLGQFGTDYDEKQDLARVDLKRETLEKPVEQFTMSVDQVPGGGAMLKLAWENTQFSVPLSKKK